MQKTGNSSFVFPMGQAGTGLQSIAISAPSLVTDAYTAQYIRNSPAGVYGGAHQSPLFSISLCEYWTLVRTTGSSNVDVTLYGNSNSGCAGNTGTNYFDGGSTNIANLRVAQWNGVEWVNATGGSTTILGTSPNITVQAASVSSFGAFTFSSVGANPLPVKLISFTADAVGNTSVLNWATASEKNNDRFDIERSVDGINFIKVGEVKGNGNTTNISKYSFTDGGDINMLANTFYYRLRQVDYYNDFEYTNIQSVSFKNLSDLKIVNVFPNPFYNEVTLNYSMPLKGSIVIRVSDVFGKVINSFETEGAKGMNTTKLDMTAYAKGIYIITIIAEGRGSGHIKAIKN
jgi:hypothetical protein